MLFCIGTTKKNSPNKDEYKRIELDIPREVAKIAKSHDCNLIHSFAYRQKSQLTFRAIFGADDVYWEGAGICSNLSESELQEMLDNSL